MLTDVFYNQSCKLDTESKMLIPNISKTKIIIIRKYQERIKTYYSYGQLGLTRHSQMKGGKNDYQIII